jgi:long-chain acyl-CoA synthetase
MVNVERQTLPALLASAADAFGGQPALSNVLNGKVQAAYDYAGLAAAATRFAALLVALDIEVGDRVMILCENRPEWAVAYFGVALAGAVAVPVLVDFLPEQIANVSEHANVRAVCASRRTLGKLEKLAVTLPRILIDSIDADGIHVISAGEAVQRDWCAPTGPLPGYTLVASDLACILYTSGTSGNSKGVMLTHGNLVSNVLATRDVFPLRSDDRVLSVMPLAHTLESTMGLLTPLLQGCQMFYLDKPPTAPVLAGALLAVRPTVMVIVPLIIEKLYRARVEPKLRNHPLYRFGPTRKLAIRAAGRKLQAAFGGTIRFLGIGGAALARDVEEFLLAAGFPYAIGYGLTETAPLVAAAVPFKTRLGSTGVPLAGVQVRIARLADAEHAGTLAAIGPDTEGEIQVRGPNVMQGYYKDPERTAAVFTEDGWFRTGDLGTIDSAGMVYVRGRLKAMILGPSGENIYPEEIESTLASSGLVEEALVYAARDGALVAMVVLNERAKAMIAEAGEAVKGVVKDAVKDASRLAADQTGRLLDSTGRLLDGTGRLLDSTEHLLASLRSSTNARLASFSRLARIVLQEQPFEKTATLKIKRYLYPQAGAEM